MSCVEAVFAKGTCQIDARADYAGFDPPRWTATVQLVDPHAGTTLPLTLPDGGRAIFHGESEPLAVNAALAYLEREMGGYAQYAHQCLEPRDRPAPAPGASPSRDSERNH